MSIFPTIYKLDSNGATRTWQSEFEGNKWRTIAGGPGRKPVTSGWTTCKGKQGRSDEQQATFEADAEFRKKLSREYRLTEAELASVPKGPMLAKTYEGWPAGHATVFCQPKLDGIRALVSEHGAFTREYQRHLNVDHITAALSAVFADYPGIQFDGELYNHNLREDFGKICSVVRKQDPTAAQREEARALIEYHVYDICDDTLPFADRAALLTQLKAKPLWDLGCPWIKFVPTLQVTSEEDLDRAHGHFLEDGYEGSMVRLNMPYEFDKRSKTLLKRKEFTTAEFKLNGVEEGNGNWAGLAKRVVFELPDGRECGAGIRGTQAEMKALLNMYFNGNHKRGADHYVTIRHFTPTPDGMPRFPVAIDFHFAGRKD